MKLEDLSPKRRDAIEKVREYQKRNPGTGVYRAAKEQGVTLSCYYAGIKMLDSDEETPVKTRRPYTRKAKMITLPVDEGTTTDKAFLLVGSVKELVNAMRDLGGMR